MIPFQFNNLPQSNNYHRNNKKIKENQELGTPEYFDFITEEDQNRYRQLQQILSSPENRYTRNRRTETLQESLDEIRAFCIRNDENDWRRCLVCGVIWIENKQISDQTNDDANSKEHSIKYGEECISINIRQLVVLLGKSKSSINGAFSKMGFSTVPTKGDAQYLLFNAMPYFRNRYFEMRMWTIRKRLTNNEPKEQEIPQIDRDIPFITFDDQPCEELKIEDININDTNFWFSNFRFPDNMYNYTIIVPDRNNNFIPPFNMKDDIQSKSSFLFDKKQDIFYSDWKCNSKLRYLTNMIQRMNNAALWNYVVLSSFLHLYLYLMFVCSLCPLSSSIFI